LAVIGSDAKARIAAAMAKERNSLREGLQLGTIHPSSARFWGFVGLPLCYYNPIRMRLTRGTRCIWKKNAPAFYGNDERIDFLVNVELLGMQRWIALDDDRLAGHLFDFVQPASVIRLERLHDLRMHAQQHIVSLQVLLHLAHLDINLVAH